MCSFYVHVLMDVFNGIEHWHMERAELVIDN